MIQHYLVVGRGKEYFSEVAKQKCLGRTSTMISDSLKSFFAILLGSTFRVTLPALVNFLTDGALLNLTTEQMSLIRKQ